MGQLALGFAADRIGRKWGSVVTAGVMLVGGILLAAANGPDVRGLFIMYTISQVGLAWLFIAQCMQLTAQLTKCTLASVWIRIHQQYPSKTHVRSVTMSRQIAVHQTLLGLPNALC